MSDRVYKVGDGISKGRKRLRNYIKRRKEKNLGMPKWMTGEDPFLTYETDTIRRSDGTVRRVFRPVRKEPIVQEVVIKKKRVPKEKPMFIKINEDD